MVLGDHKILGSPRRVRFVNVPGHRTSCVALARVPVALVAHATLSFAEHKPELRMTPTIAGG